MKKIKIIYPLLIILTILLLNNCNKHQCHEEVGPDGKGFSFRLIDNETKETTIAAWGTPYDYEDIKFEQLMKDSVRGLEIYEDGRIFFDLIDEIRSDNRDDIVGKPFTNTYYLHLVPKNEDRETDIDTIVVSSEIVTTESECSPIDFGTTTIIFNDSLYYQGAYLQRIDFIKEL